MSRIIPFNRTRIVVSAFVGVVALAVATVSVWKTPLGDDPTRIKEANESLERFRQSLITETSTNFAVIGHPSHGFVPDEPTVVWRTEETGYTNEETLSDGRKFWVIATHKLKPWEFYAVVQQLFEPAHWKDIQATSDRLTSPNNNILKAKAMVYLNAIPVTHGSTRDIFDEVSDKSLWDDRFSWAERSYSVEPITWRVLRSVGVGIVWLVISTLVSWLALLFLSWIWYFSLDRLREVSNAVRGKRNDDKT